MSPGKPQAELTVSGALMQAPGDFLVGVEAGAHLASDISEDSGMVGPQTILA